MTGKRETQLTFKVSTDEELLLRKIAAHAGMSMSDLVRRSIATAAPAFLSCRHARKIELDDIEVSLFFADD